MTTNRANSPMKLVSKHLREDAEDFTNVHRQELDIFLFFEYYYLQREESTRLHSLSSTNNSFCCRRNGRSIDLFAKINAFLGA